MTADPDLRCMCMCIYKDPWRPREEKPIVQVPSFESECLVPVREKRN